VKWYRKAADQGYASAQYNLGLMYDYGEGIARDEAQAAKLYQQAAAQDHANASWELGRVYAFGRGGMQRDYGLAAQNFLKALSFGSDSAEKELINNKGRNLPQDARREIQRSLRDEDYYSGSLDGVFGDGTVKALQDYEDDNNW
jgi:TPR repeat protein